jgi:hypothetical protein
MLKIDDIVMITPIPESEENEDWWEKEETWGSFGVIDYIIKDETYPYVVIYVPWRTEYGGRSDEFAREELTHLSKMSVK